MEKLVLENEYEIVVLLFGAAFKDFSRSLSDFPVLFKADLIYKDFSRKPSEFKYFSILCEPWLL